MTLPSPPTIISISFSSNIHIHIAPLTTFSLFDFVFRLCWRGTVIEGNSMKQKGQQNFHNFPSVVSRTVLAFVATKATRENSSLRGVRNQNRTPEAMAKIRRGDQPLGPTSYRFKTAWFSLSRSRVQSLSLVTFPLGSVSNVCVYV